MRSVHLAQESVKEYMKQVHQYAKTPFGTKVDDNRARQSKEIADSPAALKVLSEGYPRHLALRVAKLQRDGEI